MPAVNAIVVTAASTRAGGCPKKNGILRRISLYQRRYGS